MLSDPPFPDCRKWAIAARTVAVAAAFFTWAPGSEVRPLRQLWDCSHLRASCWHEAPGGDHVWMAAPDQTFGPGAFSPLLPQSAPDGLRRGIKEISGIILCTARGGEAASPSLATAGSYPVQRSLPALCSARCCEMMLIVIKLYGPPLFFFRGSCSSDLLAKITASV